PPPPAAPARAASLPRAGAASPEAIDELGRILTEAASPLIVTEEGGRSPRAVEHPVPPAELLGAPVVEGWHPGYVNFPRTHPLYGGSGGPGHIAAYLKECDVVFL